MPDVNVLLLMASLILTVPVTIITNLATPRLEAWWGSRSESRRAALDARARADHLIAEQYAAHPEWLTQRMLRTCLYAIALAMLLPSGLIAISLFVEAGRVAQRTAVDSIIVTSATAMWLAATAVVVFATRRILDTMRLYRHVTRIRGEVTPWGAVQSETDHENLTLGSERPKGLDE